MQSFVQILSELTTDPNITAVEFRLYTILMDLGLKGRGFSQAGHQYLSHLCNCHPKTIAKSLRNLKEQGYISIERVGLNRNDKIRCKRTVKKLKDKKVTIKKSPSIADPTLVDKKKNKDIERNRPDAIVDKVENQRSNDSNTPQKKVDQQRTEEVQTTLQTHMRPKLYDLWFKSVEVIESDNDLTEICLNAGDIGYDHISKFYLDDVEKILGTEVKLI